MCEWERTEEWRSKIRQSLVRKERGKVSPFYLLSVPGISGHEQLACADLWMQGRIDAATDERRELNFQFCRTAKGKIRLGYLSSDFHEHATSLLLIELFEWHDRNRFHVSAYSYGTDDDGEMRQRLKHTFDDFVDVSGLSDAEAARRINADGIDILIDLKGYTRSTRTFIMTLRPSPVLVNYLGYPGTLGGKVCDYLITDPYLTPTGSADQYSEALAYLPHSYQPHGRLAPIGQTPSRTEVGLPINGFVFCCFNQAYKITAEIFDVWCRLLADVPDSVLWLLQSSLAKGNLRNAACQRGIDPNRLVFAKHKPQREHLGRLKLADLVLDTSPYNAHTTASDALWVGVPLVTCPGSTFASRVAGSLLSAIGLPELITDDLEAYYQCAYELATNREKHRRLQDKLKRNRLTTPLFNIRHYARDLESLYEAMWSRYLAGKQPVSIRAADEVMGVATQ
ncbi:MAG: UDP-N-acetylglucosamine-peptide N-acetylglucosaminyltransferase [Methylococcaceae bacterium]|nr:UDP-N-acetylglucosamine-peptide N-acetylglucosaminyltransferase [Methylococcaceae bacterium]